MGRSWRFGLGLTACLLARIAVAGEAAMVALEATPEATGTWRFSVAVRHADTGWEHYADKWQVLGPDGAVLG
jgi:hypothetical protein